MTQRLVPLCFAVVVISCSDDLPTMDPLPEDDDEEMREDDQSTAGDDSEEGGSGGTSMTTRNAGSGGASGRGGTSGEGGSGGETSSTSGTGGSGGMSGGTMMREGDAGSRPPAGGSGGSSSGAAGATPSAPVVAACMGRPGETVCDNAVLIKCGEDGGAEKRENCKTAEQCRAGLAAGTCGMCDPGAIECLDAELRECSMTGEFMVKETCQSDALCNEAEGMCDAPACAADEHKCETGQLLKCKDDRTEFEVLDSCPMELCDAAGKKCNVCVPSIKECDGNTLKTCAADGSGYTEMACAAPTDQCASDRCVQCTSNEDCTVSNECQEGSCNLESGRCNPPSSKPLGTACSQNGGRVCGLGGLCLECNIDSDCSPTERCGLLGCVQRVALQPGIAILPGTISVTLNAGYALKSTSPSNLGRVTYSAGFFGGGGTVPTSGDGNLLQADPQMARTVTFTAEANGSACQPTRVSDTRVTLRFANPTSGAMPTANCGDQSVTIYAVEE